MRADSVMRTVCRFAVRAIRESPLQILSHIFRLPPHPKGSPCEGSCHANSVTEG